MLELKSCHCDLWSYDSCIHGIWIKENIVLYVSCSINRNVNNIILCHAFLLAPVVTLQRFLQMTLQSILQNFQTQKQVEGLLVSNRQLEIFYVKCSFRPTISYVYWSHQPTHATYIHLLCHPKTKNVKSSNILFTKVLENESVINIILDNETKIWCNNY